LRCGNRAASRALSRSNFSNAESRSSLERRPATSCLWCRSQKPQTTTGGGGSHFHFSRFPTSTPATFPLSTYLPPTFSILRILPQLERPQRPPYATIRGNWISVFSGRSYNSEPRVLPTLSRLNVTKSEEANWGVLSITHRFTPLS
jgi:hypothetical protein